jgi:hypothetical protein
MALCSGANDRGQARRGIGRLAADTGCAYNTVRKASQDSKMPGGFESSNPTAATSDSTASTYEISPRAAAVGGARTKRLVLLTQM